MRMRPDLAHYAQVPGAPVTVISSSRLPRRRRYGTTAGFGSIFTIHSPLYMSFT